MDVFATILFCLALAVPVASTLIAARLWRAQLMHPRRFVVAGLLVLYLTTGYLMTRPIPTHAVRIGPLDAATVVDQGGWNIAVMLALLILVVVTVASVAVVFALRRIMSR
jgi:hypothetical protein